MNTHPLCLMIISNVVKLDTVWVFFSDNAEEVKR